MGELTGRYPERAASRRPEGTEPPRRGTVTAGETPRHQGHRLEVVGRERLTVSGVEDVERFDETGIVMTTTAGVMVISGTALHIGRLSLDGGELHVEGRIDAISYEDAPQESGGFFSRLFG